MRPCTMFAVMSATAAVAALAAIPDAAATAQANASGSRSHQIRLNNCWINARGIPVLKSLSRTPDAVDTDDGPKRVHFTVHAVDRGAKAPGIGSVIVGVHEPGNTQAPTYPSTRVQMTHQSGATWVGSIELPQHGQHVGTWTVDFVQLRGKKLHSRLGEPPVRTYFAKDLAAFGPMSFTVTDSDPDDVAPTIDSFSVPGTVNTSQHPKTVRFKVRAEDTDSGVGEIVVHFFDTGLTGWPQAHKEFPLHLHAVPSTTDLYRAPVRVPKWIRHPRFRFQVQVRDRAGNITVSGDDPDVSPPASMTVDGRQLLHRRHAARLSHVSVTPTHVDLRSGSRRVTVKAHVRVPKPIPLPQRIVADQYGRNPWQKAWVRPAFGRLHRISGTARNGTWRTHLLLPRCTTLHAVKKLNVRALYAGFSIGSAEPGMDIRTADHRPSTFQLHQTHIGTDDPVSIRFDEAVTGITGHTLVVAERRNPSRSRPRISGTWTCRNGASDQVDCAAGRVRTATFQPDDPWPVDTFWVIADPGHHLGLVDLAGNLGRFSAGFSS